jgi:diadenosine tetraphosphate (Ap4A) HIT family hydrolase
MSKCPLCSDLAGDLNSSGIAQLYGPRTLKHAFLWSGDDLYLTAGPGTLMPGYMILAPKRHAMRFTDLGVAALREGTTVIERVRRRLEGHLPFNYMIFEHGPGRSGLPGAACVDHAHIHLLPVPDHGAIHRHLQRHFSYARTPSLAGAAGATRPGEPYILVSDGAGYRLYDAPFVQRQLIRRLAAAQLGAAERWDWRSNPEPNNFWETVRLWRAAHDGDDRHDH